MVTKLAPAALLLLLFAVYSEEFDLPLSETVPKLATYDTPVYYAHYRDNKIVYEKIKDAMKDMVEFLKDSKKLGSEEMASPGSERSTKKGNLRSSRINARLARSLPDNIANEYSKQTSPVDRGNNDQPSHSTRNRAIKDLDEGQRRKRSSSQNVKNSGSPDTNNRKNSPIVFLRVLVQLDYSYREMWSENKIRSFLAYIVGILGSVDQLYQQVDYPKIKFSIAAIVIATHPMATPFIVKNMDSKDAFDYEEALPDTALFYYSIKDKFPLNSWDLAVTMTKFKLGNNGDYTTLGIAYTAGLCDVNHRGKYHCGLALVHDDGEFSGILTAAHEIGHLLGLEHDVANPSSECSSIHGFLMTEKKTPTRNTPSLSSCSLQSLREIFDAGNLTCLHNTPATGGKELPRIATEKMVNLDKQCKAIGEGPSCILPGTDSAVCGNLQCFSKADAAGKGNCVESKKPVRPGTPCINEKAGKSGLCFDANCIGL